MKARVTFLAAGVALLAACDANPLTESSPSQLVASVEGGVTAAYGGTGEFSTAPAGLPRPFKFLLRSEGRGAASNQGFQFHGPEMPGTGSYALGAGAGVQAIYSRKEGGRIENFAARAGEIVITESSPTHIVGTFRFDGVLASICAATHSSAQVCTVSAADPSAPQITASGSFEAVPARRHR